MNTISGDAVKDFDIYLLMTMRRRLSMADKNSSLEGKLAEYGSSLTDAERRYQRISGIFNDEATAFNALKDLLGIADPGCAAFQYPSVLWPGFEFEALGNREGFLKSARFRQVEPSAPAIESPSEIDIWSVDVDHFAQKFQPLTPRHQTGPFDRFLPSYGEYEFSWAGERYGARFIWGLFLSSSILWD